ncbi:MAG: DUF1015 domain-containing protein [Peptostreptococcaceae bacterium]
MAIIKPFRAIRPNENLVDKVAALPYDVMNSEEAKIMSKDNPYSFLHIDKSEIDLEEGIYEYDEKVYLKAKENLDKFKEEKILIKEERECLYIYKQVMDNRAQVGIVATLSVEDSLTGVIKKHEYTKPDKEKDRTNHIRYCNANTGTILVTYKSKNSINEMISNYMKENQFIYNFTTDDKITHTVWKIDDNDKINFLIEEFKNIPYLYIADGHHRSAAAENIAKEMRINNPKYTGGEEFNYYLAMIAPEKELMILDYNRVVKDLNGMSEGEFIDKIREKFEVYEIEEETYKPNQKGKIGMYLNDRWYEISIDNAMRDGNVAKSLDISILQDYILGPMLGIDDPKTDKRIDFVGGIRGLGELEKRVSEDMKVAFAMYPTSIEELMSVADADEIMPAKSTWFEPKVRCGLFLHELGLM